MRVSGHDPDTIGYPEPRQQIRRSIVILKADGYHGVGGEREQIIKRKRAIMIGAVLLVMIAGLSWTAAHTGLASAIKRQESGLARRVMKRIRGWHSATAVAMLAPVGAAQAGPVPPTTLGIHISSANDAEPFANLAIGASWSIQERPYTWTAMPPEYVDAQNNLKAIPPGARAGYYLITPQLGKDGMTVRCTFTGKATMGVEGPPVESAGPTRSNDFRFRWTKNNPGTVATLTVKDMDPANPVRNIDCRNASIPRDARFTPAFLDLIKGFKVLRFMDWQNTNANNPVTWATRHTPASSGISLGDGVSIEDMMALAKLNDSDPWFNMPWRSDDDYYRRFAQYVHDTLPPGHVVYLELSNEVWNTGFAVGRQAIDEGMAACHVADAQAAQACSYGDRLIHVMDIWAKVFADDPGRLVRIASGQDVNLYRTGLILGYKDVTKHVDAFATSPYFGYDTTGNPNDIDEIYRRMPAGVDEALARAVAQKALAHQQGLRFIAYESGQGIATGDVDLLRKIQRDPRMYDMYMRYIDGWRARVGDTLILFGTVYPINAWGAWGLVEYLGQPASEAPKLRAAKEQLSR